VAGTILLAGVAGLATAPAAKAGAATAATSTPAAARSAGPASGFGRDTLHLVRGHVPGGSSKPHAASSVTDGPLLSTNWSGQLATGGTYTSVQGSWTVPTVPNISEADYSASWIGIDGTTSSTLIQTGTAQQTGNGESPQYYGWYELLPNFEQPLPNLVEPGDSMTASITETSKNIWKIVLTDTSEAWTFQTTQTYKTPGTSAEWIEEAPTINGLQSTLADYGSTTFTGMAVGGSGTAGATYSPIYMIDPNETEVISWPSAYDPATTSFAVQYGSPTPVITGVSPAVGPTSGDTPVTLTGQYLFAAFDADFGGASTSDLYRNSDGTVTVASPPGSVGTVDIILGSADTSSTATPADQFTYSSSAPRVTHGYWLVGADGGIFSFGSAGFHGSTGNLVLQRPVVGITPTADRNGYWLVATDGGVFAFGDSGFYGSLPGLGIAPAGSGRPKALNAPIVGMVPSSDDHGYFMVARDGGVFAFGDAQFEGSCPGIGGCSGAAVSVLPDASGHGYWLVTTSGNVYTFGDAPDEGSPLDETGGQPIPFPVVSAVRTPDGAGYWILFNNGIVLSFGDANLYDDDAQATDAYGQVTQSDPATAIFATGDKLGYWIASAGGSVYDFGSAQNDGSMAGVHLNAPIIAATGW
jgi:hypothetical protein